MKPQDNPISITFHAIENKLRCFHSGCEETKNSYQNNNSLSVTFTKFNSNRSVLKSKGSSHLALVSGFTH